MLPGQAIMQQDNWIRYTGCSDEIVAVARGHLLVAAPLLRDARGCILATVAPQGPCGAVARGPRCRELPRARRTPTFRGYSADECLGQRVNPG
jgi:hypothetical protein